jgi:hypothetical protein
VRAWADTGAGLPNGRPGSTVAGDQAAVVDFPSAAGGLGPTHTGVSFPGKAGVDDVIDVDLVQAGATLPGMTVGRYWLSVTPSIVGTTNTWYAGAYSEAGKTPHGVIALPNSTTAANKAWRDTTIATLFGNANYTGWPIKVVVNAACGAPWLSYSATSGALGVAGSAPVTLTLDATGLTPGVYTAYACLSGNGTSPEDPLARNSDSILIPVTFTVVAPPNTPTCTATPNPAAGATPVTISCSGATVGTTNTIPGAVCSPNPTTDGTFTCTGTGSAIGSNPTLTTTTAQGDNAKVVVALTVDTTPPVSPTCTAAPSAATATAAVTVTCTGVEAGTTNSFPSVSCTPDPATATGTITCTGTGATFGNNPVLTSTDPAGNSSHATASFSLKYTVTANAGSGGSVTAPGQATDTATVVGGTTASFTFAPNTGYQFDSESDTCGAGGSFVAATGVYTTGAVTADCAVSVTFKLLTFTLTYAVDNAAHGSLSGTTSQTVSYGGSGTAVTANATPPYHFVKWSDNNSTTNPRTDTNVTANVNATAIFAIDSFNVTATAVGGAGAHGTITPPTQAVASGSTATFTVTPEVGYHAALSGDHCTVTQTTGNTWTSSAISADCTVSATFTPGYVSVTPARILDTRTGGTTVDHLFEGGGALGAQGTINVNVLGRGGVANSGVNAVVVNVTATNTTGTGFVTVWPTGSGRPTASNLNVVPGISVPNLVIVKLGPSGQVSLFNSAGSTDLIADVVGYFTDVSDLTSLPAARLLDTRPGRTTIDGQFEGDGALAAHAQVDLTLASRASLPAAGSLGTVIMNVTATDTTAEGFVSVWPTGQTRPTASTLNFLASQTVPNLVIGAVSSAGQVSLYNSAGSTDLIADVTGWFPATSGDLTSLTPARLLETRAGRTTVDGQAQTGAPLAAKTVFDLAVTGRGGIPANATGAVILNITVTQPAAAGFLVAWPSGIARPATSNLNFAANQTIANLAIVHIGSNGKISLYNNASTDAVVDVVGYLPNSP